MISQLCASTGKNEGSTMRYAGLARLMMQLTYLCFSLRDRLAIFGEMENGFKKIVI